MKKQSFLHGLVRGLVANGERLVMLVVMLAMCVGVSLAKVDITAGQSAMTDVTTGITAYVPLVRKLIYAIAAIVAIVGGISVYVKMNNEEQDVKKSIMMIVGACIFLLAAATALPLFFGISS